MPRGSAFCQSGLKGLVALNDIVRQMIHHVPVRDLTIFGLFFSELGEEIRPSGFLALLAVITGYLIFGDLML